MDRNKAPLLHLIFLGTCFSLVLINRDGTFIHVLQVLRMMVGVNISDEQLGSIADRTIQEADTNGDNSISFNEFIKVGVGLFSLVQFHEQHQCAFTHMTQKNCQVHNWTDMRTKVKAEVTCFKGVKY